MHIYVIFWGVDHSLDSSAHTVCSVFDYDYYYDYLNVVLPDSFSPLLTVSLEVIILEYSSSIAGLIQDVIFY